MIALRSRFIGAAAVASCAALLAGTQSTPAVAADPSLDVQTVRSGLAHPWAMTFTPARSMLYTQRDRETVTLRTAAGKETVILREPAGMWHGGETGLMGIEVDQDFASTRVFYTCHGYRSGSTADVRVVKWRLNAAATQASLVKTLVTGLPSTSGRHGGCALLQGKDHTLMIGTGDAAVGANPQSLRSGGGKVLRVSTSTGAGVTSNPFSGSGNSMTRRIYNYGHRNVQGLARSGAGQLWSVEQGSYRDDEANRVDRGGNYGWNPVPRKSGDPSYNEGSNSPMTDFNLPGVQKPAGWSSGGSTIAASGADFVRGSAWGSLDGALAIAALKNQQLRVVKLSASGTTVSQSNPAALNGTYGRLRAVRMGPDGALYVTTSTGDDDRILRVTPKD